MCKPNTARALRVVNKPNLNVIIKKDKLGENQRVRCTQSVLKKFKVDCTGDTEHTKKIEKSKTVVLHLKMQKKSLLYSLTTDA